MEKQVALIFEIADACRRKELKEIRVRFTLTKKFRILTQYCWHYVTECRQSRFSDPYDQIHPNQVGLVNITKERPRKY